jgi:hypothetical protein
VQALFAASTLARGIQVAIQSGRQSGRQLSVVRIQAAVCDDLLRFWSILVDC